MAPAPGEASVEQGEEHVYLTGHASLNEFLSFRTKEPLDAPDADLGKAANEWRAARDHLKQLEFFESLWADNPPVLPIPRAQDDLRAQVVADPIFRRSFALVPVELGVVELDRLIVRHKTLNLAQVERVRKRFASGPGAEEVFRLCLPFDHPDTEHRMAGLPGGGYVFTSPSNNLRFLEPMLLPPGRLVDYQPLGPVAGVVALAVGFGSNYVNAIATEGRLVLNNGHHRLSALRCQGVTHAPCVVQKVTRTEELKVLAAGTLRSHPEAYLKVPRPPVLKDYFDPKIRSVVRMLPTRKHVKVTFKIEEEELPA